ncbi:unnamed protein product [Gongylonema pulchrum]|uniref:Uncharacterized protein n=1 Tax=Gongylonema pulchrum TaxID=637853 RepID=A0A3P7RQW6_9BILA|nr:unnamed protein product [Gongylonema pulchrum]
MYIKGGSRGRFEDAMSLLNKNIAQLRWWFGLTTNKTDSTLLNLQDLLLHIISERSERLACKQKFVGSKVQITGQNVKSGSGSERLACKQKFVGSKVQITGQNVKSGSGFDSCCCSARRKMDSQPKNRIQSKVDFLILARYQCSYFGIHDV